MFRYVFVIGLLYCLIVWGLARLCFGDVLVLGWQYVQVVEGFGGWALRVALWMAVWVLFYPSAPRGSRNSESGSAVLIGGHVVSFMNSIEENFHA